MHEIRVQSVTTPFHHYGDGQIFSPVTATLLTGPRSAVLVDTQAAISDGRHLSELVRQSGKTLTHVYITHGHFDHFLGGSAVRKDFPDAKVVALPAVREYMRNTMADQLARGKIRYGDDAPDAFELPEALVGNVINLDDNALFAIEVKQADISPSSFVYVPSIDTVIAGDVAYNGIHLWLGETTSAQREEWIKSVSSIAALKPRSIVTGHKKPEASNDRAAEIIDETGLYLESFNRLLGQTRDSDELFTAMLERFPDFGNPSLLRLSADAAFSHREA